MIRRRPLLFVAPFRHLIAALAGPERLMMAVLEIVTYPDPVLSKKCKVIEELDTDTLALAGDMMETMLDSPNGIGLAAPQVGRDVRLIVVEQNPSDQRGDIACLINPEVIEAEGEECAEEGCLSLPDHYNDVTRAEWVKVKYLDQDGNEQVMEADGLLARCLQHEIDHLEGKLVVDYASSLKRAIYRKKRMKEKKRKAQAGGEN